VRVRNSSLGGDPVHWAQSVALHQSHCLPDDDCDDELFWKLAAIQELDNGKYGVNLSSRNAQSFRLPRSNQQHCRAIGKPEIESMMPISSLRHVFADTVADVDGFIVRTRLGNRSAVVSPAQCRSFADSPPNRRAASTSVTKQQPSSSTSGVAFVSRCGLPEGSTAHVGNGGSGVGGIGGPQVKGRRTRQVLNGDHYADNEMAVLRRSAAADEATSSGGDVRVAVVQPPTSSATTGCGTANESECKQSQQPEALCALNCCCCCTGRLLLMWLQVSFASHRLASLIIYCSRQQMSTCMRVFHVKKKSLPFRTFITVAVKAVVSWIWLPRQSVLYGIDGVPMLWVNELQFVWLWCNAKITCVSLEHSWNAALMHVCSCSARRHRRYSVTFAIPPQTPLSYFQPTVLQIIWKKYIQIQSNHQVFNRNLRRNEAELLQRLA
jgi:hypothetical protein